MNALPSDTDWTAANHRCLTAELAALRGVLIGQNETAAEVDALREARASLPGPDALSSLCAMFQLSIFERTTLLLCAGVELDSLFAESCAQAQGGRTRPTFSLALARLPEPHWNALLPSSPLRHWRLVEIAGGDSLTSSPLRIDERILHYLTGLSYLDERLQPFLEPIAAAGPLAPSQEEIAVRLSETWQRADAGIVELLGEDRSARREIAASAAARAGMQLFAIASGDLPLPAIERDTFARLWDRETILDGGVLLVEGEGDSPENTHAARALVRQLAGRIAFSSETPLPPCGRSVLKLEVPRPPPAEQQQLWTRVLGPDAASCNGTLDAIAAQFSLGREAMCAAGAELRGAAHENEAETSRALWDACRRQSRRGLDHLAQRIEPTAAWDDLVLPELQRQILREMTAHVRQRTQVYERWGFAAKSARGLGLSALFTGGSGTGKTMAAEVIAAELRLDLYRIDLSSVVSKYIGETEKNLARVFTGAEQCGAVLLFDEADALFGKRSEVKDSHDRYANVEISYLLQRMESYRGLAILTTNMKEALDPAFLRRIRFVVQFPFPDQTQRAEIWRRIFPKKTPTDGLDVDRLARLSIAGGNIRNIALHAAFTAAGANEPVRMPHLLRAARLEYQKLEKQLTETEVGGWS